VAYTAQQAARLSGCTPAQLEAWTRVGLVKPDAGAPDTPFGFRDLVALRMVRTLLDAGLPTARIRRAVGALLSTGEDLTGVRLVAQGDTVFACRDDGQILDALGRGQLALFVALDRMADDVRDEVARFDADRRAFVASLAEPAVSASAADPGRAPDATGRGAVRRRRARQ
jgi:DNA-binding transcriptional MerR regulator